MEQKRGGGGGGGSLCEVLHPRGGENDTGRGGGKCPPPKYSPESCISLFMLLLLVTILYRVPV